MQRMGGGSWTRKAKRGGGNNPSCGCDMQAGWPKFLTENIPLPTMKGGASCGIPPIPNYYQGGQRGGSMVTTGQRGGSMVTTGQRGGGCAACSGLPLPTPMQGGGQPAAYNSNPVPDACPFPGTGYCEFYARGGANYGEPMYLQARLRGGKQRGGANVHNLPIINDLSQHSPNYWFRRWWPNENNNNVGQWTIVPEGNINNNNNNNPTPIAEVVNNTATNPTPLQQEGGGCGCGGWKGGYKPTKKNLKALKKWRRGQSIGFTMTSSLKAKGLIPRTSRKNRGKKVVSAKYK